MFRWNPFICAAKWRIRNFRKGVNESGIREKEWGNWLRFLNSVVESTSQPGTVHWTNGRSGYFRRPIACCLWAIDCGFFLPTVATAVTIFLSFLCLLGRRVFRLDAFRLDWGLSLSKSCTGRLRGGVNSLSKSYWKWHCKWPEYKLWMRGRKRLTQLLVSIVAWLGGIYSGLAWGWYMLVGGLTKRSSGQIVTCSV